MHQGKYFLKSEYYDSKMCDMREDETEQDPVGLLGIEDFLSPFSCRQDSSLHDLP